MSPCANCDGPCIPTCVMSRRSIQDLLAERRALIVESMRERDKTAKAMLAASVADLDHEIRIRQRDAAEVRS